MPPIIIFGRKWNIATDDFVYLSFWEFLIRLFIIVAYVYFNYHENMINNCNSKLYQTCHFLLSGTLTCNLILIFVIMILSAQGLIMEESKRSKIPLCIYLKLFMSIYEAILSIIAFAVNYQYSLIPHRFCEQILIPNKIILFCIGSLLFVYLIIICITYDKLGRSGSDVILLEIKKTNIWKHRLKWILCIKTTNKDEGDALNSAANIFASLCEESNLVYSDFEAGIQLLCKQDANAYDFKEYSLEINKSDVASLHNYNQKTYTIITSSSRKENYLNISNWKNKTNELDENILESDPKEVISGNHRFDATIKNVFEDNSDLTSDWRDVRLIYYFSTMAKASYGWPLHLLFHDENKSRLKFCMGLCCKHSVSCFCNKCICCDCEKSNSSDQKLIYVKERFCSCHEKAILNETLLEKENLICVSFYNKTFHSPFFIAISHEIQVVILSIRGTFSLKDVLTDMDANLIEIFENGHTGYLAHSGMLNAAKNIQKKIQDENIIHNILNDYKNYRLIITGHSLGAGIATILSCFYYHEFPNLKCYAFSPPLGTVNIKTADYCKDFVLTIVNGVEWVPRISLQSIVVLKRRLIESLENYPHSKYQLLIKKFLKCKCYYCTNISCQWNILNSFERDEKFWQNIEINTKLPGQILHIANIEKLNDSHKSDLIKSNHSFYTPIITSSEQFNTILFHPKMFKDHFPNQMVKRLFKILYENQRFYPICHHYLKHYWPESKPNDIIKLPFISGILNPELKSIPNFQTTNCNRNSFRKKINKLEDSDNSLCLISKITVV